MSKDLFSSQASTYARYRPTYPAELYKYILSFVQERKYAWDCATGNGQAARALSAHFGKIAATDLSETQIQQAQAHPKIVYSVAPADHTSFPDGIFDLITVAQAYHWLDFAAFAKEARRVAKPGGVIAVWGYGLGICEDAKVRARLEDFYQNIVGPYWDPERKYLEASYRTVPFPFAELPSRSFTIPLELNREEFLGYLNSWSSVQHYIRERKANPVDVFAESLTPLWEGRDAKRFETPLFLRLGRLGD